MRGILAGDAWRHSPGHDGRLHQESLQATSPGMDSIRHVTKNLSFLFLLPYLTHEIRRSFPC
jgi:hypothetical protein